MRYLLLVVLSAGVLSVADIGAEEADRQAAVWFDSGCPKGQHWVEVPADDGEDTIDTCADGVVVR